MSVQINKEHLGSVQAEDYLFYETSDHDSKESSQKIKKFKVAGTTALAVFTFASSPSTSGIHHDDENYKSINMSPYKETYEHLSDKIQEKISKFEQVFFEYPAYVVSVDKKDRFNNPEIVTICVSVEGKNKMLKRSVKSLGFQVSPKMDLKAQGIKRGESKKIKFYPSKKADLTQEEKDIISSL